MSKSLEQLVQDEYTKLNQQHRGVPDHIDTPLRSLQVKAMCIVIQEVLAQIMPEIEEITRRLDSVEAVANDHVYGTSD